MLGFIYLFQKNEPPLWREQVRIFWDEWTSCCSSIPLNISILLSCMKTQGLGKVLIRFLFLHHHHPTWSLYMCIWLNAQELYWSIMGNGGGLHAFQILTHLSPFWLAKILKQWSLANLTHWCGKGGSGDKRNVTKLQNSKACRLPHFLTLESQSRTQGVDQLTGKLHPVCTHV